MANQGEDLVKIQLASGWTFLLRRSSSVASDASGDKNPVQKPLRIESFANLCPDFARTVVARMTGPSPPEIDRAFPTVEDGVKGLAFVKAAIESSATRQWRGFEMPSI